MPLHSCLATEQDSVTKKKIEICMNTESRFNPVSERETGVLPSQTAYMLYCQKKLFSMERNNLGLYLTDSYSS